MTDQASHSSVVAVYEKLAPIYDWIWYGYLRGTFRWALQTLQLTGSERILDVACGTGELERWIVQRHPRQTIVGVDITEGMLARARVKLAGAHNIAFQQAASESLPFPDASFDIVVNCSALHYMRQAQTFFHEAARVLKSDGRFLIIDWCRDSLRGKTYNWIRTRCVRSHHLVYSAAEVREMLARAGFQPPTVQQFVVQFFWGLMCVEARKPG